MRTVAADQRAVVLGEALERLVGQVQPVERGVAALQLGDDAQRLGVVVETAAAGHQRIEHFLAGMAEGGVAEIVRQRHRLGEILVELERAGDGAGELPDLDRVREPGAEMVALVGHEDLGLVRQPAKRGGMDDAVAVALKLRSRPRRRLGVEGGRGCAAGRRRSGLCPSIPGEVAAIPRG